MIYKKHKKYECFFEQRMIFLIKGKGLLVDKDYQAIFKII